ncbi:MAG: hypothetical protein KC496_08765 [Anaerolineae bacterium]|nr:hypothetical protein [Anaerolineae bacterium]
MTDIHILRITPQPPLVASALPFWHVWVDSDTFTTRAHPFYARDRLIGLQSTGEFPDWQQTQRRVSVRRVGAYVLWLPLLQSDGKDEQTISQPMVFHGTQYTSAIDKAITQMQEAGMILPDHSRNGGWYSMTAAELRETLALSTYDAAPQHMDLLRQMQATIEVLADFDVCDPPAQYTETRIPLSDGKDAVWQCSRIADEVIVRFVAYPFFPLWLRSPALDAVFKEEILTG